jgi:membrane protease YdiL (CAAX protease family)|tara:strand:+ start:872 stop:1567 length:696 start_codon:yes stop_codon:yes gene_type:complete
LAIKDKSELLIFIFLLVSLGFLTINFKLELGTIFLVMIVTSMLVFFGLPARLTHNSKPRNTFQAILDASIALGIVLISTIVLSTVFQGFLTTGQEFSLLSSGFSSLGTDKILPQSAQPIFAQSAFLTILTFGIIIAMIETRFLARVYEALASVFKVNLNTFNTKVIALTVILSALFVAYHFNAKGITDNVSLLITFIFAFVTLELVRRRQELEAATYLHIFNNLLFIIPRT